MSSLVYRYRRTGLLWLIVVVCAALVLSPLRVATWEAALPVFEWMEQSLPGRIGQTWGAVFALVQALHLLGMSLLGGAVLVADARLLGAFRPLDADKLLAACHKGFQAGLLLAVLTGGFMACGVAIKIYYLPVYWYKMLALLVGVGFVYGIRRPLLAAGVEHIPPGLKRAVAMASLMIWFSVAATGRWIGFSG